MVEVIQVLQEGLHSPSDLLLQAWELFGFIMLGESNPAPLILGKCSTTELSLQLMLEYFKARSFLTYTITVLVCMCGSSQANTGTQLT